VQSDTAWNCATPDVKVYYFEAEFTFLESSANASVGIAFAPYPQDLNPGWEKNSYGYERDGMTRVNKGFKKLGPKFGQGDTVGVGLDTTSGELFFTRNGEVAGNVEVDKSVEYFPTVGANQKSKIKFNFAGPFVYKGTPEKVLSPAGKSPQISKLTLATMDTTALLDAPSKENESDSARREREKLEKELERTRIEREIELERERNSSTNSPNSAAPSKGHIMLSYQWGSQELVKIIYKALTDKGYVVWMDIEGGMRADIFQSMAEGVEGAVVFVPLLTSKYMASPNCRRECTAATEMKKPIIPIMCEHFEASGWLRACITGLLWYPCFDHKMSPETMQSFMGALDAAIPKDSPARKPNLTLYISYSIKNRKEADILRKKLEEGEPHYICVMSAEEKLGRHGGESSYGTPASTPRAGESKKSEGNLKKTAMLEEKLRKAKAVLLILSPDFESSDECKNDVSLSYSHRKFVIPILVKILKKGYPPREMEFALKSLNPLDFVTMINNPQKHSTMMRRISDALSTGSVNVTPMPTEGKSVDFKIKTVGFWSRGDVENWLAYVGLPQYIKNFQKKYVNGRVLLNLTEKDLDALGLMKLHQRRFFAAVSELFNGLNWNEDEVAEWLDSIGLQEVTHNLYDAHINGQSLLMLTENDLHGNNITDPVVQKCILLEVQHLKETRAKVPISDELYRFKVLRSVLRPQPTTFSPTGKFSAEVLELFRQIYDDCNVQKGLTQVSFKKFLLCVLVSISTYHETYPTKDFWLDLNTVEVICMKNLAKQCTNDMDDIVTEIDDFLHSAEDSDIGVVPEKLEHSQYSFMCLAYVMLMNIFQRLFAIIDRQANGIVTWAEMVAGLELIMHGSTEDKFKLALCLVDYNGDGDISQEEFAQFYSDCFLPVVKYWKLTKGAKTFEQLHKGSFLYTAYQAVREVIHGDQTPVLLNNYFTVEDYRGFLLDSNQENLDSAVMGLPWGKNTTAVWYPFAYHPHELCHREKATYFCKGCRSRSVGDMWTCKECQFCLCQKCYDRRGKGYGAGRGRNVDLLLKFKGNGNITLTNLCIGGQFNCSPYCMVKHILVWVTMEKPNIRAYTSKYDDYTAEIAESSNDDPNKPYFITTDPNNNYLAELNLQDTPIIGKYVHIKLMHSYPVEEIVAHEAKKGHKLPEENEEHDADKMAKVGMAAEFIGLWGFQGENPDSSHEMNTKKLFSLLSARYDRYGASANSDGAFTAEIGSRDNFKINKYVSEFVRTARDFGNGGSDLSQEAVNLGIAKKEVEELNTRLAFLSPLKENPASVLMLITPIIHLFRLFYGHNAYYILTEHM